jgi:CheY-like chemotaxis protein
MDMDINLPCPDLLLLDLYLPKRDGVEILKHLRASQRCSQIPVLVLTSSAWIRDQHVEENDALHYFVKPISLDQFMDLGRIVKEVISRGQSC